MSGRITLLRLKDYGWAVAKITPKLSRREITRRCCESGSIEREEEIWRKGSQGVMDSDCLNFSLAINWRFCWGSFLQNFYSPRK